MDPVGFNVICRSDNCSFWGFALVHTGSSDSPLPMSESRIDNWVLLPSGIIIIISSLSTLSYICCLSVSCVSITGIYEMAEHSSHFPPRHFPPLPPPPPPPPTLSILPSALHPEYLCCDGKTFFSTRGCQSAVEQKSHIFQEHRCREI